MYVLRPEVLRGHWDQREVLRGHTYLALSTGCVTSQYLWSQYTHIHTYLHTYIDTSYIHTYHGPQYYVFDLSGNISCADVHTNRYIHTYIDTSYIPAYSTYIQHFSLDLSTSPVPIYTQNYRHAYIDRYYIHTCLPTYLHTYIHIIALSAVFLASQNLLCQCTHKTTDTHT
jgi:hypothetical protein